jgi:hypothetical protein
MLSFKLFFSPFNGWEGHFYAPFHEDLGEKKHFYTCQGQMKLAENCLQIARNA